MSAVIFSLQSMLPTINLQNETTIETGKIDNKLADWMLSSEFVTSKSATSQVIPQELFSLCLVLP